MREMRVGETGVLQYLEDEYACLNGSPATILETIRKGDMIEARWPDTGKYEIRAAEYSGYAVRLSFTPTPGFQDMLIECHQIRPWHNPDQQEETDHAEERESRRRQPQKRPEPEPV